MTVSDAKTAEHTTTASSTTVGMGRDGNWGLSTDSTVMEDQDVEGTVGKLSFLFLVYRLFPGASVLPFHFFLTKCARQ